MKRESHGPIDVALAETSNRLDDSHGDEDRLAAREVLTGLVTFARPWPLRRAPRTSSLAASLLSVAIAIHELLLHMPLERLARGLRPVVHPCFSSSGNQPAQLISPILMDNQRLLTATS